MTKQILVARILRKVIVVHLDASARPAKGLGNDVFPEAPIDEENSLRLP